MKEINPLIVELIQAGGVFTISYDSDRERFKYDLNTQMKSHCYVTQISKNILKCEMRYEVVKKVNTSKITAKDFAQMICDNCLHGRTYMSCGWNDIFKHYDIKVPEY